MKKGDLKAGIADYKEVIVTAKIRTDLAMIEIARLHKRDGNLPRHEYRPAIGFGDQNSPQGKMALLEAGGWGKNSKDKRILEQASHHKIYVDSFTNDSGVPTARFERAKILIKLNQFPLASQYLKNQF